MDDYEGALAAVEHLIDQGYQRIAHINGNEALHHSQARKEGYLDALKKNQLPIYDSLIFKAEEFTLEEGFGLGKQLLNHPMQPDAVFSISDEVVLGVHQYLQSQAIMVPRDFGLVGFSDSMMASLVSPPLSSVRQPGIEMGKLAVKRLLELINAEELDLPTQAQIQVLKTELIIRKSSLRQA